MDFSLSLSFKQFLSGVDGLSLNSHACICCTCPIEERVKITYVTYKILCLHLSFFLVFLKKISGNSHSLSGCFTCLKKKTRVLSSHVLLQSHHNFCRERKKVRVHFSFKLEGEDRVILFALLSVFFLSLFLFLSALHAKINALQKKEKLEWKKKETRREGKGTQLFP